MKETQDQIVTLMNAFIEDANKKPNKAAHQRMRKVTLQLAKLGKEFRRLSLEEDSK